MVFGAPCSPMKKGLQTIGAEIRAQRLRLSLSLRRFARRIEVSEDDAEAIERGEYELDVLLLFRIGSVLKTPTSRILRRAEERRRRLHSKGKKSRGVQKKEGPRARKPSR
jgi:transcriptional regulator with XRE-family HTH domain